ncbi:hypothetical protein GGR57DRAFT_116517 [Xylariaceae sp. FL1272]|nr:hypothetical protein GGR57DRAFT_116517 [Xylariaceae sp. FL1272]
MVYITKTPLFHRKSKSNLLTKSNPADQRHLRKFSSASTISQASSETGRMPYDPLSLHPPLTLNTSPAILPEYDMARYREDEAREDRFFNQTRHADDHIHDFVEYSPIKGKNCWFEGPKARPYIYDQDSQWPLKDWQAIPPGSSGSDSQSASTSSSPTRFAAPRERNTDWMEDTDVFVKRGPWKRQGIIFHLDDEDKELEEKHFELPEETN